MKKLALLMLVVLFAAQGIAFAEDVKSDTKANDEPVAVEEVAVEDQVDPATGNVVEEDAMVAEELVTPPVATEEAKKM